MEKGTWPIAQSLLSHFFPPLPELAVKMSGTNYHPIETVEQFRSVMGADLERVSVLSFWAEWAAPCKEMNPVVKELAKKYETLQVLSIEADSEELEDITESFDIKAVPSFIILRGHTLLEQIPGADAEGLQRAMEKHSRQPPKALTQTDQLPQAPPKDLVLDPVPAKKEENQEELNARMRKLMNQSKFVLFMKGSPDAPRCGFSRQTVGILREQGVEFAYFDILTDEAVRQGMKRLNNWPTFPQIIANGELIGGLDVLKEMIENGEFEDMKAAPKEEA